MQRIIPAHLFPNSSIGVISMSTRETFKISLLAKMPKDVINQFLSKDKTPFSVLFLSLLVGILAGLVGTYFEQAVHLVSETRTDWLKSEIGSFYHSGWLLF